MLCQVEVNADDLQKLSGDSPECEESWQSRFNELSLHHFTG